MLAVLNYFKFFFEEFRKPNIFSYLFFGDNSIHMYKRIRSAEGIGEEKWNFNTLTQNAQKRGKFRKI